MNCTPTHHYFDSPEYCRCRNTMFVQGIKQVLDTALQEQAKETIDTIVDSFYLSNDKLECYRPLNKYIEKLKHKYLDSTQSEE